MTPNRNLIVAVVLVLFATALLVSSLDYSSDVLRSGGGPDQSYAFVGSPQAPGNRTPVPGSAVEPVVKPDVASNASDPFLGLFRRNPGNGGPSADVRDSGASLLITGLIAAAVAVVSATAFIIVRRRRKALGSVVQPIETAPAQPDPVPDLVEGLFRLRFPSIREPFPLTWGAGEPLEMEIVSQECAAAVAMLSVDGGEQFAIRLESGRAVVPLMFAKGIHQVRVSPIGGVRPAGCSVATLRIVDYREEIVRMFNDLCHRLRPSRDEALTPRELERTAGAGMPEAEQKLLETAVATFEVANYSLHDIRRADFEIMYLSGRGVT